MRTSLMQKGDINLQDMARVLRSRGLRVTPQRRLVFRLLREHGGHPDADELYRLARQQQPQISLSTIYRALDVFEGLGLVWALHLEGAHHRYEIAREDGHHHLVCLGCGKVIEFQCAHCAQVHQGLADGHGFQITGSRVELLGYCAECQKQREQRR